MFILRAQAPDGCLDCWNCVGRWVNSGRRENGDFTLECAAVGAGPRSPRRDSLFSLLSHSCVPPPVFPQP